MLAVPVRQCIRRRQGDRRPAEEGGGVDVVELLHVLFIHLKREEGHPQVGEHVAELGLSELSVIYLAPLRPLDGAAPPAAAAPAAAAAGATAVPGGAISMSLEMVTVLASTNAAS